MLKSDYTILGFEDENGKEYQRIKGKNKFFRADRSFKNVREEIGGFDKYKKVIIFLKQVEVVEDNDCTSYVYSYTNYLTIEK